MMPESILNFQDFLPETIGFSSGFFCGLWL